MNLIEIQGRKQFGSGLVVPAYVFLEFMPDNP
jgi:hypothetical protein